jgi:eukaryotic-like serine/threonine-protein kinase
VSKALKAPVIAGKYTLLRKLGAGGMAEVFLAKQHSNVDGTGAFEKLVVIKRIIPHLATGPGSGDFLAMFFDEARLASDLRHPNIVNVIDIGKSGDAPFIVMEFLHGQDVRKVQRKNAAWGELVPLGHACQIAIDAAAGLHYAHKKVDLSGTPLSIVHRDVSPQNIIVTYEGATKIVDFGIAKAASQSTHTQTGVLKGKYTYMSPEQAAGEVVDAKTDQFALGIVLWELLTMRRLFKRESEVLTLDAIMSGNVPRPSRFREEIPAAVDDVVMKALATKKEHRFRDCEQLASALEDALTKSQIAYSQGKLAQYMRRMFADQLAEEATLGLVNPDGSLTRNFTPFTLPPPEQRESKDGFEARPEAKQEVPKKVTIVEDQPKDTDEEGQRPDVTTADRKSARSRSEPSAEKREDKKRTDVRGVVLTESQTEPTKVENERQKPARREKEFPTDKMRGRDARGLRQSEQAPSRALWVAALVVTLAIAVSAFLVWNSWSQTGHGTLVVRSEPRGAVVFVDEQPTGQQTPALIRKVLVGEPHKIRVELDGKKAEEIVTIDRRGTTLEVLVPLPR